MGPHEYGQAPTPRRKTCDAYQASDSLRIHLTLPQQIRSNALTAASIRLIRNHRNSRIVTTRREPVVTMRNLPQPTRT